MGAALPRQATGGLPTSRLNYPKAGIAPPRTGVTVPSRVSRIMAGLPPL